MYIISPMSIYLLGLVDSLLPILFIGATAPMFVALFVWMKIDTAYDMSENKKQKYINFAKRCVVISIVMSVLWVITPTKETIIQMLIAKNITVDRVQIASEVVQKVYNDIIGVISK